MPNANEAPPAIISMYLGDDLDALVHSIINGEDYHSHKAARMQTGVDVLADFKKDKSDRFFHIKKGAVGHCKKNI